MSAYEIQVRRELLRWENQLLRPPGLMERASKQFSDKVNQILPQKVHDTITATVKGIVRTVLAGIEFAPQQPPQLGLTLAERDARADELLSTYKKIAAAEGAGTGAGGIMLGLVDFPALLAIKMRFLFELSHLYGFSTRVPDERLFVLQVFQLAFSSPGVRPRLLDAIRHWDERAHERPQGETNWTAIDWEQFQREYRDCIDFRKMLQLVPGIGAVVGAWANYGLLEELGGTAKNCFRMRLIRLQ
ncbi:EcsC family protein [Paenibacillus sp. y28]|uniref:EcsC family protein n=1 Tax=Paenibacillus sp. y28 TaxID=3129110 RepID=UPI003016417D